MYNQPPTMPPVGAPTATPAPRPSVAPSGSDKLVKANKNTSLVKTVVIILLTLLLIGALVLAYYFYNEYRLASSDVDSKVETALAEREKEITDKLEADFAKREKEPFYSFVGPEDYGSLSFKYPKTWSVYIAKDASSGGNFEAYLHPSKIQPVSAKTINALRVTIETNSYEKVIERYKNLVTNGSLTASVITVGGSDATRYDGKLTNDIVGSVVIFKIRDKTVLLQTDADIYREDFSKIIESVTFNN